MKAFVISRGWIFHEFRSSWRKLHWMVINLLLKFKQLNNIHRENRLYSGAGNFSIFPTLWTTYPPSYSIKYLGLHYRSFLFLITHIVPSSTYLCYPSKGCNRRPLIQLYQILFRSTLNHDSPVYGLDSSLHLKSLILFRIQATLTRTWASELMPESHHFLTVDYR